MHRRLLTILLPLIATIGLTSTVAGCSTFTDSDAAARVNDTELSSGGLADLLSVLAPEDPTGGDSVRNTIQLWVLVEVSGAQFEADATPLTSEELTAADSQLRQQLADFDTLPDDTRTTLVNAQATLNVVNVRPDAQAFVQAATDNADVYVNPRFGRFDPTLGVVALDAEPPPTDTTQIAG